MASTSSSSVQMSFKYDVFLSFRGEDTRKTFVDHLYHALHNRGITPYKDDETIEKGERISDQLLRSIEESRFNIIVFSKKYASSSWCLDELVKIMECQKTIENTAYPIFYDVEPTEVRNQSGAVGEAFAKHVEKEAVGRWRDALKEAAGLVGWEVKNTADGHEAKLIQKIVEEVSLKLHVINLSFDGKLVGMETRVKDVVSSLNIGSEDVRMIGIRGLGGGGKTTLARAVFDHISISFEGMSFVDNVREGSKGNGLKELQKQVLKDVLNDQNIDVTSVYDGKSKMRKMMSSRKVLVVLDDVDDVEQLEALAGELNWFKPGSRIIITTRDKQVLVAHRVNYIHDVNLLSNEEAICLFSKYAFGRDIPDQGYEELSQKVVYYAAGLPLTHKVLGSHLCGRNVHVWVDAIERLKTIPLEKTLKRLEISYVGLEDDQKEIFLDVVCILKGESKDYAIRALGSCGFNAQIGLSVLEQKSLITISDIYGLRFHDHIEEMGWNIVRRLHPHSRLWIQEEIQDILVNDLGTEETKCIKLNDLHLDLATIMNGLRKMRGLRYLHVDYAERIVDGVCEYLPDALRYLYWQGYPFCCLPKTFRANKLVNLQMPLSCISQLWEAGERKVLDKLRFLDLSHSKVTYLNLGMTPHLEELKLQGCNNFVELQLPVQCPKLKFLDLSNSKVSILNLGMTPQLEHLDLQGCNEFVELHLPVECPNLKNLDLYGTKLRNLNLGMTPNLEELGLAKCNELLELQLPIECPNLEYLNLYGSKLCNLNLGMTPHLKLLSLEGCNEFLELNLRFECPDLKILIARDSKLRNLNLGMTPHIEKLDLGGCNEFVELHLPVECPNLRILNLRGSKLRNLNLGMTPHLEELYLEGCNEFLKLHLPSECSNLKYLNLGGSKVTNLNLAMTPHLEKLDLRGCYYLKEVHAPVGCVKKLVDLNLSGCLRFKHFLVEKRHVSTDFGYGAMLELTTESLNLCPLHPNSNLPKFQFTCKYSEPQPSLSGNLEKLISFGLCACTDLESFSTAICNLQYLRVLTLDGSIPKVPKDMYKLEGLKMLTLRTEAIRYLPDSICMLKHLRYLYLKSCWLLEKLPKDLGRLESLEQLDLTDCVSLRDIPSSICYMKGLRLLFLPYCILVEKLPEELGRLKCLKELDIEGAGISRLPQSIFQLEDVRISGSRWQLESYGFTSLKEDTSPWRRSTTSCCVFL